MTTKLKIIIGFATMIVLLAVMAVLGYRYLDKSVNGLVEYRRLARMNVRTSDAMLYLSTAAAGANMFLVDRDSGSLDSAAAALDEMDANLTAAQQDMSLPESIAAVNRIRDGVNSYRESLLQLPGALNAQTDQLSGVDAILDKLTTIKTAVEGELTSLSTSYDQRMTAYGVALTAESRSGQKMLLGGSAIGLLLGLALALFIILGLIRVLREAGAFAGAIAKGDFAHAVNVKEGGEIGLMVSAMRQIPAVLSRLAAETKALAESILGGHLRKQLDISTFPGSFGELTKTVNTLGNAFTSLVDDLGVPIMCCDKERRIVYLSRPAQELLGGDLIGRQCADELNSDHCGHDTCFGFRSMRQKNLFSSETTIRPRGQTMQVSATSIPLYDQKREVVGYTEVLTDLTDIKTKQAIMLQVASEASEISNRIAAASEELSAQVEQVSRGAEVQRDRISSTSSAMTEMNSTVLEVARNSGEASEQSENTRQKAQQGAELVDQVMSAISEVNTVSQNLHVNMQELGQQAESIGNVMAIISDIADQTNLLALNAAIEAARAGEAGRGFAVVADEVRKLAEKTMQATYEVGSSISAVQQSAQTNISQVAKSVTNVTEANGLAVSAGKALTEIVNMASSNSAVVASIATAAEEQSATSEEISRATEEINRIVFETTEGMVQSSAAVQELSTMAQELRRVMEGLK